MYSFLLVVTVFVGSHPVKFYHTSHERFAYHDQCIKKGVETGDAALRKIKAYRKKAKASVECEQQVTFES